MEALYLSQIKTNHFTFVLTHQFSLIIMILFFIVRMGTLLKFMKGKLATYKTKIK